MTSPGDPQSEVRLSIALVTRNRPQSLRRTLASFRAQTVQPFEIVVSDDSGPDVAARVREAASEFGCRYVAGPRRGLYANRNHVARLCAGTHILTSDDDHEHPGNYLAEVCNAIAAEPATVWCMGEVSGAEAMRRGAPWARPGQIGANGALQDASCAGEDGCWAISDGATAYPRSVFDDGLRFFDGARFGDSYKEFGCLLHWLGVRIRVLPATGVLHHIEEVGRSYAPSTETRATTIFAVLMLCLVYQPSLRNVLVGTLHLGAAWVRDVAEETRAIGLALRFFRGRRAEVLTLRRRLMVHRAQKHVMPAQ